jgi:hypothetical protein
MLPVYLNCADVSKKGFLINSQLLRINNGYGLKSIARSTLNTHTKALQNDAFL